MFQRIFAVKKKEFIQIFRDRKMRAVLLIVPLVQSLLLGYAVSTDIDHISLVLLDQDGSPVSRQLLASLTASKTFFLKQRVFSIDEGRAAIQRGEAQIFLFIPSNFSERWVQRELRLRPELLLLIDGSDANTAKIIQGYAEAIILGIGSRQSQKDSEISVETRSIYNSNMESRNTYVPGIVATVVSLVTLTLTSMAIVREKEVGTMEQVNVTPIKPYEFILGKTIPFVLIGLFDLLAIVGISHLWFLVPFRGSVFLLVGVAGLYVLTTLGVGLLISTVSNTQQQALLTAFLIYFPLMLLSGFFFPVANMPELAQWLSALNPMKYFIICIRTIFLKGGGFGALWKELIILSGMGMVILSIAKCRFKKRA